MKKIIFLTILISSLFFLPSFSLADIGHNHEREIEEGRELVESKISCDKLSDEQLEAIGDYLMEQMHPGESHEAIHKTMNMEEGTEYHKQFHVNIAQMMYCSESGTMGMMPMMNMMNQNNFTLAGLNWFNWVFIILFLILIILGIIGLIIWIINQIRKK